MVVLPVADSYLFTLNRLSASGGLFAMKLAIKFKKTGSSVNESTNLADDISRLKVNTKKRAFVDISHLKIVTLRHRLTLKEKSHAKFAAASRAYPYHGCEKAVQAMNGPGAL